MASPPPFHGPARGFTLIEVVISLVLVAVLAGLVVPVVVQQLEKHHAVVTASDLVSIGRGVEQFHTNVWPTWPGDLEDLANPITTDDRRLDGTAFSGRDVRRWFGAYIASPLEAGDALTGDAIPSGFDSEIQNEIACFDVVLNDATLCDEREGVWVAVKVLDILGDEFALVNDIIDDEFESDAPDFLNSTPASRAGRLRYPLELVVIPGLEDVTVYYLVKPYRT